MKRLTLVDHFAPFLLMGLCGLLPCEYATADGMSPTISLETTWKYIPADSEIVAWFDIERLRKSGLVEPLFSLTKVPEGHRKNFREALGVPVEMIAGLVIAGRPSRDEAGATCWLIRLNRPLRVEEILANLKGQPGASNNKARSRKVGSHDVYTTTDPDSDEFCLLNDRLILLASAGAMRPILTRAKSEPPTFFAKASHQIKLTSPICVVATLFTIVKDLEVDILGARVDAASLHVDVGEAVEAKIVLVCHNKSEAEEVRSIAKLGLDYAKGSKVAELNEFANTVELSRKGVEVVIISKGRLELWKRILKQVNEVNDKEQQEQE